MWTIDEMHECIVTYLREGGYPDNVWTPGVKYDTGASTCIPVFGMTFTLPPTSQLVITEGWTLETERGNTDILPKVCLGDNNQTRLWYTEIRSRHDLVQYLQSKLPTAESIKASNIALEATRLRNEQQTLYETAVKECVLDSHVNALVSSTMKEVLSRGLNQEIFPKLKERLVHHLTIKLLDAVQQQQ